MRDIFCGAKHQFELENRRMTRERFKSRFEPERADVYQWGTFNENHESYPRNVFSVTDDRISQVACGSESVLIVTDKGYVWGWGSNSYGELGVGQGDVFLDVPTKLDDSFDDLGSFVADTKGAGNLYIASGASHAFVIARNGSTVYGFGRGLEGQIGLGDRSNYYHPTVITELSDWEDRGVVFITCGQSTSMAVTSEGEVYTWGRNSNGELGHGHFDNVDIPTKVEKLSGVKAVDGSCGDFHMGIVTDSGHFFTWGNNHHGQLGQGEKKRGGDNEPTPRLVNNPSRSPILSIHLGDMHSLALTADGEVLAWGSNSDYQLGLGDDQDRKSPCFVNVDGYKFKTLAAGSAHSMGVTHNGKVCVWGMGESGVLGIDLNLRPQKPYRDGVTLLARFADSKIDVASLSTRGYHACAIENGLRLEEKKEVVWKRKADKFYARGRENEIEEDERPPVSDEDHAVMIARYCLRKRALFLPVLRYMKVRARFRRVLRLTDEEKELLAQTPYIPAVELPEDGSESSEEEDADDGPPLDPFVWEMNFKKFGKLLHRDVMAVYAGFKKRDKASVITDIIKHPTVRSRERKVMGIDCVISQGLAVKDFQSMQGTPFVTMSETKTAFADTWGHKIIQKPRFSIPRSIGVCATYRHLRRMKEIFSGAKMERAQEALEAEKNAEQSPEVKATPVEEALADIKAKRKGPTRASSEIFIAADLPGDMPWMETHKAEKAKDAVRKRRISQVVGRSRAMSETEPDHLSVSRGRSGSGTEFSRRSRRYSSLTTAWLMKISGDNPEPVSRRRSSSGVSAMSTDSSLSPLSATTSSSVFRPNIPPPPKPSATPGLRQIKNKLMSSVEDQMSTASSFKAVSSAVLKTIQNHKRALAKTKQRLGDSFTNLDLLPKTTLPRSTSTELDRFRGRRRSSVSSVSSEISGFGTSLPAHVLRNMKVAVLPATPSTSSRSPSPLETPAHEELDRLVEEYCSYWNISLADCPECRWIVEAAATCPVIEPWDEIEVGSNVAYRHKRTGEVIVEHPLDGYYYALFQTFLQRKRQGYKVFGPSDFQKIGPEEVTEMMEYLGISESEFYLSWVAREGLLLDLPDGWHVEHDQETDTEIYVFEDGSETLDHPLDAHLVHILETWRSYAGRLRLPEEAVGQPDTGTDIDQDGQWTPEPESTQPQRSFSRIATLHSVISGDHTMSNAFKGLTASDRAELARKYEEMLDDFDESARSALWHLYLAHQEEVDDVRNATSKRCRQHDSSEEVKRKIVEHAVDEFKVKQELELREAVRLLEVQRKTCIRELLMNSMMKRAETQVSFSTEQSTAMLRQLRKVKKDAQAVRMKSVELALSPK